MRSLMLKGSMDHPGGRVGEAARGKRTSCKKGIILEWWP